MEPSIGTSSSEAVKPAELVRRRRTAKVWAQPLHQLALLCAIAMCAYALISTPAIAKTCASQVVYARGEPASFEWIARMKTHANWRAKVRAIPNLGDPYANWSRAENSTERCFSGADGTVCQFTGTPCRKD